MLAIATLNFLFLRLHDRPVLQVHRIWMRASRCYSTEPIPKPQVDGEERSYAPKIQKIVEDISKLTLLEVSDLNELLKVRTQTC